MFLYEVTATVNGEVALDFELYMTERHIPELLATGHFAAAFFAKNGAQYRIGYHANSQQDLDHYFAQHADRLRSDLLQRFPRGIVFSRQILEIVKLFTGT